MHRFAQATVVAIAVLTVIGLAASTSADARRHSGTVTTASLDLRQLAIPSDFFGTGTSFGPGTIPLTVTINRAGTRDLTRSSSNQSSTLRSVAGVTLVEVTRADGFSETWRATVSLPTGAAVSAAIPSARSRVRTTRFAIRPVVHFERVAGGPRTVRILETATAVSIGADEPARRSTADRHLSLTAPPSIRAARAPAPPDSPSSPTSMTTPCLAANLATGFDEGTGAVIAAGGLDADWEVVVDPIGGTPEPRPAEVVTPHPAWDTQVDSAWISADTRGPNGTYIYQFCFCLEAGFTNASVSLDTLSDDAMQGVFLNGTLIGGPTPVGPRPFDLPAFHVETADQSLFVAGQNCLDVQVDNQFGVVTGLNVTGTVMADDGSCCGP